MPRDPFPARAPSEIAVIGTGIAGMAAAWLLARSHRVTVYEKARRIGGHSNTVDVPGPDGPVSVDTGFIVYNEPNYPNLVALFDHLGVATRPSDMSFAVSLDDGRLEYSGTGLGGLFAQRRNLVRPRFWRMIRGITRFYREGPALLARPDAEALTLGAYLHQADFGQPFVEDHLLPMAAAVWSTPVADMRRYPAASFVRFNLNHGLMRIGGRPEWRTVAGGSRAYVERLTAPYRDRIRLGARIRAIAPAADGLAVIERDGRTQRYDHVVIATHADEALALLDRPTPAEQRILGAFSYARNEAVLHTDPDLMPRRRRVWASWNYLRARGAEGAAAVAVTYWMNRLQGLDPRRDMFVTLNPPRDPAPEKIVARFTYDHPVFDQAAIAAQGALGAIQGPRGLWFCGSYCGHGFHEDAFQAGLAVAEAIGGVRRPWQVAGESDRLGWAVAAPAELAA
ncbi:MAG: FAD-dependent oxidoreductase [Alphaproteobacteria bacterium]|nr:FAD-dependent oxidoreductase [Alphaproteobacteria bacterium]